MQSSNRLLAVLALWLFRGVSADFEYHAITDKATYLDSTILPGVSHAEMWRNGAVCTWDCLGSPSSSWSWSVFDSWSFYASNSNVGYLRVTFDRQLTATFRYAREAYWDANCPVDLAINGNIIADSAVPNGNHRDQIKEFSVAVAAGDYIDLTEGRGGETCGANIYSLKISSSDEPTGACFHGDGTVLLESGSSKRLSELSLGERIQTSDGGNGFSFNPVLTLPHANNSEPAAFLTLTTETGKMVDMTTDHLIPKCDTKEVTAGDLVVGDCVLTVDGKETLLKISSTAKNGVFTAITQDKFIVVDGIVASSYSKGSDPTKPELDYEKYRAELKRMSDRRLALSKSKLNKRLRAAHE